MSSFTDNLIVSPLQTGKKCGNSKSRDINAHHKDGYHWCKDKRYDINNGVCLCQKCHKEFHSIYGIKNNTEIQWLRFLLNINDKIYSYCKDLQCQVLRKDRY